MSCLSIGVGIEVLLPCCGVQRVNARFVVELDEDVDLGPELAVYVRVMRDGNPRRRATQQNCGK
jgi:hypothetical protein